MLASASVIRSPSSSTTWVATWGENLALKQPTNLQVLVKVPNVKPSAKTKPFAKGYGNPKWLSTNVCLILVQGLYMKSDDDFH